ncbi:hypothetical protein niasHT_002739 [Heterodera trifolii]|uniref:Uncharacterized protein n=1 Tax=Heterodera trifolii TaxID=157864 RepID=A0ABD2MA08_9BILA
MELIVEIVTFLQFRRRWANVRVSRAFDHFMLEQIGLFLTKTNSSAQQCLTEFGQMVNNLPSKHKRTVFNESARNEGLKLLFGNIIWFIQKWIPNIGQKIEWAADKINTDDIYLATAEQIVQLLMANYEGKTAELMTHHLQHWSEQIAKLSTTDMLIGKVGQIVHILVHNEGTPIRALHKLSIILYCFKNNFADDWEEKNYVSFQQFYKRPDPVDARMPRQTAA